MRVDQALSSVQNENMSGSVQQQESIFKKQHVGGEAEENLTPS